jgi:hypothetical protein
MISGTWRGDCDPVDLDITLIDLAACKSSAWEAASDRLTTVGKLSANCQLPVD